MSGSNKVGDHDHDYNQNYQDQDDDEYNIMWDESSSYLFSWSNIRNTNEILFMNPNKCPSKSCQDGLVGFRSCGFGQIGELGELPASICRELANLVQALDTTFRPPFLFCIFYSNPMLTIQINPLLLINRVLN